MMAGLIHDRWCMRTRPGARGLSVPSSPRTSVTGWAANVRAALSAVVDAGQLPRNPCAARSVRPQAGEPVDAGTGLRRPGRRARALPGHGRPGRHRRTAWMS